MYVFVGLASIVVLALRGGGPRPPTGLPVVAAVNGSAMGQSPSGETTIDARRRRSLQEYAGRQGAIGRARTQASLGSPPEVREVRHEAVQSTAPPFAPKAEMSSLRPQAEVASAQSSETTRDSVQYRFGTGEVLGSVDVEERIEWLAFPFDDGDGKASGEGLDPAQALVRQRVPQRRRKPDRPQRRDVMRASARRRHGDGCA